MSDVFLRIFVFNLKMIWIDRLFQKTGNFPKISRQKSLNNNAGCVPMKTESLYGKRV